MTNCKKSACLLIYIPALLIFSLVALIIQFRDDDMFLYCQTISCFSGNYLWHGYVFMCSFITMNCLFLIYKLGQKVFKNPAPDTYAPLSIQEPQIQSPCCQSLPCCQSPCCQACKAFFGQLHPSPFVIIPILAFNLVGFFPTTDGFDVSEAVHMAGVIIYISMGVVVLGLLIWRAETRWPYWILLLVCLVIAIVFGVLYRTSQKYPGEKDDKLRRINISCCVFELLTLISFFSTYSLYIV